MLVGDGSLLRLFEELGEGFGVGGIEAFDEALQDIGAVPAMPEKPLYVCRNPVRLGPNRGVPVGTPGPSPTDLSFGVKTIKHFRDGCVCHVATEALEDVRCAHIATFGPQDTEDLCLKFASSAAVPFGMHLDRLRRVS